MSARDDTRTEESGALALGLLEADASALDAFDLPADAPSFERAGWRIEVLRRGKFWQWATRGRSNRQTRYGGKFNLLSDERQAQYEQNKRRRTQSPAHRKGRSVADTRKRNQLLPAGRA